MILTAERIAIQLASIVFTRQYESFFFFLLALLSTKFPHPFSFCSSSSPFITIIFMFPISSIHHPLDTMLSRVNLSFSVQIRDGRHPKWSRIINWAIDERIKRNITLTTFLTPSQSKTWVWVNIRFRIKDWWINNFNLIFL